MNKHIKENNKGPFRRDEKDLLWIKINDTLGKKRRLTWLRIVGAAAAVFIMAGGLFFFLPLTGTDGSELDIARVARTSCKLLKDKTETSILEFSDKVLDKNSLATKNSLHFVADSLLFAQSSQKYGDGYKTVYVPYGRRQDVILADGTKIWLNSGSYLTFPSSFSGKDREVYLNGEAYFDVAHNIKPFKVLTRENTIRVLGTSFNVSSYEDDSKMVTGLISGSIAFENNKQLFRSLRLQPGEELSVDNRVHALQLKKSMALDGILWTKKQLALNRTPMAELMKKLERIYNVSIHFSPGLAEVTTSYMGRIDLNIPVDQVLRNIYELEDYHIVTKNKEVTISN